MIMMIDSIWDFHDGACSQERHIPEHLDLEPFLISWIYENCTGCECACDLHTASCPADSSSDNKPSSSSEVNSRVASRQLCAQSVMTREWETWGNYIRNLYKPLKPE
jgi:hypothetical protein